MARFPDDFDEDDFDEDDWDDPDDLDDQQSLERNHLGEEVHAILNHAEHFELLALDPTRGPRRRKAKTFHGWPILGQADLLDEIGQQELVAALNKGLSDWSGELADCAFAPRYALRAFHGHQTADVLLCFECHEIAVYLDAGEAEWLYLSSRPATARVYDTIFRQLGLPRAD